MASLSKTESRHDKVPPPTGDSINTGSIPLQTLPASTSTSTSVSGDGASPGQEAGPASAPDAVAFQEGGVQGWIVVAGSTINFFVVVGLVYCFGVMQAELLRRRYATSSTLGWVSSTTVVLMPLFAIPITALIRHTSNRTVGFLGALCTGCGYIATSFTFDKSIATLFCAQALFVSRPHARLHIQRC